VVYEPVAVTNEVLDRGFTSGATGETVVSRSFMGRRDIAKATQSPTRWPQVYRLNWTSDLSTIQATAHVEIAGLRSA
jgi:hypothetical protein